MNTLTIKIGTAPSITTITPEEYVALQRIRVNMGDIMKMVDADVFDFRRGRAVIHRDDSGKLRKIELELTKWSE